MRHGRQARDSRALSIDSPQGRRMLETCPCTTAGERKRLTGRPTMDDLPGARPAAPPQTDDHRRQDDHRHSGRIYQGSRTRTAAAAAPRPRQKKRRDSYPPESLPHPPASPRTSPVGTLLPKDSIFLTRPTTSTIANSIPFGDESSLIRLMPRGGQFRL